MSPSPSSSVKGEKISLTPLVFFVFASLISFSSAVIPLTQVNLTSFNAVFNFTVLNYPKPPPMLTGGLDLGACPLLSTVDPQVLYSEPICGGANLETGKITPKCWDYQGATLVMKSNEIQWICGPGTFLDKGGCYKCPDTNPIRSEFPVDSDLACQGPQSKWSYKMANMIAKLRDCPPGSFFDFIQGGSCWKCPSGFPVRTLSAVNSNKACTRTVWTVLSLLDSDFRSATFVQKVLTVCPVDTIFDIISGGSCWKCPAFSTRTVYPVNQNMACENRYFARAVRHNDIGCPPGTVYDPINGGTCWRCPIGYDRTVYSVQGTSACINTHLMWRSDRRTYGFFNIPPVALAFRDLVRNNPNQFLARATRHLNELQKRNEYKRYIKDMIQQLDSTSPQEVNPLIRSIMLEIAIEQIGSNTCLGQWLRKYVENSRIYIANEAVRMMNSWKIAQYAYQGTSTPEMLKNMYSGQLQMVPDFNSLANANFRNTLGDLIFAQIMCAGGVAVTSGFLAALIPQFLAELNEYVKEVTEASRSLFVLTDSPGLQTFFVILEDLPSFLGVGPLIAIQIALTVAIGILQIVLKEQSEQVIWDALYRAQNNPVTPTYAYNWTHGNIEGYNEFSLHFVKAVKGISSMPQELANALTPLKQVLLTMFAPPLPSVFTELKAKVKANLDQHAPDE